MSQVKLKNRWLIAVSAVGIHISIGSVYAYSVMTKPLNEKLGWEKMDITFAFSIAILFLGLSSAFLGYLVDKRGPSFTGRLSAICYSLGIVGTGFAIQLESYIMFVIAYGVLGGIGLGLGYITPVSTLVKWFPNNRGLATGMAIMGFGFASLIFGPLMAKLFVSINIPNTFYCLGMIYFILMFISASYLEEPPEGYGVKISAVDIRKKRRVQDISQSTAKESLGTIRFYFMWFMLFSNITCGIAIIAVASPMAQEVVGMTHIEAATMVGLLGLFNGLGRIGWASFSDMIGRPRTYILFFLIQIIAFFLLAETTNIILFQFLIFVILSCYGGGFATVPAFLGDLFGTKALSTIHGYTLTAWAAAGLVGPSIVSYLNEVTSSYSLTLYIFSSWFAIALIVAFLLKLNMKKMIKNKAESI